MTIAPETVPTPPEARAAPAGWDATRPPRRFRWVFAAVWLYFLLDPLRTAWKSPTPLWRVVALAALLAFAAGFVWFFAWWRHRPRAGAHRLAVIWSSLAVGLVLLALAAPGTGQEVVGGFIYVGVAAAMTLPVRQALGVVAGLVALVLLLPRVVPGWVQLPDFLPSLLLACFAAYGIAQMVERNAELLQARAELVGLAVTQERERLARDVHDILGHSLTVITVKTELAGRLLEASGAGETRARAELADVERLARGALADVRATVSGMRQLSLTGELAAARQALDAAGIAAELPSAVDDVPPRSRELFAFALREGVTNVVRHSGASRCVVRLTGECLEVGDDGRGPGGAVGGSGLAGLRGRAAATGALVEIGRSDVGGFLLRVTGA